MVFNPKWASAASPTATLGRERQKPRDTPCFAGLLFEGSFSSGHAVTPCPHSHSSRLESGARVSAQRLCVEDPRMLRHAHATRTHLSSVRTMLFSCSSSILPYFSGSIQANWSMREQKEVGGRPEPCRGQKELAAFACAAWRERRECEQRRGLPARCENSRKPSAGLSPSSDLFLQGCCQHRRQRHAGNGVHLLESG